MSVRTYIVVEPIHAHGKKHFPDSKVNFIDADADDEQWLLEHGKIRLPVVEMDAKDEPEPGLESESDPKPETEPKPEPGLESESDPKPETEPKPEPVKKPAAKKNTAKK